MLCMQKNYNVTNILVGIAIILKSVKFKRSQEKGVICTKKKKIPKVNL